ncbi:hypothetical protein BJ138DRAFT_692157 [Hygrophoropsis aurantiaca]|uniref:Uncharacterized protein n=1 Tax=Hygrophoropsis aurantiaca TaxID=72124 RepID=A0ACB8AT43_9AGAM|nr:hypothetical protein BJ138DRAFT_692157 [Hygrophoropsis aurantiaca]
MMQETQSPATVSQCYISQLPTELLVHILEIAHTEIESGEQEEGDETDATRDVNEHVQDADSPGIGASSAQRQFIEMDASHVCRYWRNVVLQSPVLWTILRIDLRSKDHCPVHHDRPPFYRVQAYARRSQSLPLEIHIQHDWDGPLSIRDFKDLLDILFLHINRWTLLSFTSCDFDFRWEIFDRLSDPSLASASQLKSLRILEPNNVADDDHASLDWEDSPSTLVAPQLNLMELHSLPPSWWQPIAARSPLTLLSLDCTVGDNMSVSFLVVADALRSCPALVHLSIRDVWYPFGAIWRGDSPPTRDALTLPSLTTLTLTGLGVSAFDVSWFLHQLFAPNLTKLVLRRAYFTFPFTTSKTAMNLIHGLKELHLLRPGSFPIHPTYLIYQLKQLVTLHIDADKATPSWLKYLHPLYSEEDTGDLDQTQVFATPLPSLRTLEVTAKLLPDPAAALVEVQALRNAAGYPLRLVIHDTEEWW